MTSILIDGKKVDAKEGQMLIDVADAHAIDIPRFCYHPKLSVAANCRMCLVEVKGAKKPMPACATPVSEGMIVNTKSSASRAAQKSVMEFLLINHPLDCPICDQGGECELQDVSLEFGRDVSRYSANKRVVPEKNIGPLIHTDLTRCIHCTRCVRFGQEVGGIQELGMTRRGEYSEIGTFLEHSVDSELSGNVIDLCPVGALTSKPFRYSARPWELVARESIAAHDSAGSNCIYHVKGTHIKRVVPKENEEINEVWLSDRDRFGYEGLQGAERVLHPMVKDGGGVWKNVEWQSALDAVCEVFKDEPFKALVNPNTTLEELALLKKIAGFKNGGLDTRIRQRDLQSVGAGVAMPMGDFEKCDVAFIVGSALTQEHPMLAHRLRKGQSTLFVLDAIDQDFRIPNTTCVIQRPALWVTFLAEMVKFLLKKDTQKIADLKLEEITVSKQAEKYAQSLLKSKNGVVLLGNVAQQLPNLSVVESWAQLLSDLTGATLQILPDAANTIGAKKLGCAPFNTDAVDVLASQAIVLYGIDPDNDTVYSGILNESLADSKVVVFANFRSKMLEKHADIILPISTYVETAGTFINMNGKAQSFSAVTPPLGDSKPGWKVLRVLANLLNVLDCDYTQSIQIRDAFLNTLEEKIDLPKAPLKFKKEKTKGLIDGVIYWHAYALDAALRNASALQETKLAQSGMKCQIHPKDASDLEFGSHVELVSGDVTTCISTHISEQVAAGTCLIPAHSAALFYKLQVNGTRIV